jgi:hypothetical protein
VPGATEQGTHQHAALSGCTRQAAALGNNHRDGCKARLLAHARTKRIPIKCFLQCLPDWPTTCKMAQRPYCHAGGDCAYNRRTWQPQPAAQHPKANTQPCAPKAGQTSTQCGPCLPRAPMRSWRNKQLTKQLNSTTQFTRPALPTDRIPSTLSGQHSTVCATLSPHGIAQPHTHASLVRPLV